MENIFLKRQHCPSCHSLLFQKIYKLDTNSNLYKNFCLNEYTGNFIYETIKDVPFELNKCKKCNLIFQNTILSDNYTHLLYDQWTNQELALKDHLDNGKWKFDYYDKIFKFIKLYFYDKSPNEIKVLDYGAGFGTSLLVAKRFNYDTYSYEPFEIRNTFLFNNGIKSISKGSKEQFDFIIIDQVIEHTSEPDKILNELYSMLKNEGIIYLAVPNCSFTKKMIYKLKNCNNFLEFTKLFRKLSIGPYSHINFFNNSSLNYLIKNNNFKKIFPFKKLFILPLNLKDILRLFYHHFFSTVFYLKK